VPVLLLPMLVTWAVLHAAPHHRTVHHAHPAVVHPVLAVLTVSTLCAVHAAVMLGVLPELLTLLLGEDAARLVLGAQVGEHHVGVELAGALQGGAGGLLVEALGLGGGGHLAVDLLHLRHHLLVRLVLALVDRLEALRLLGGEAQVLAVLKRGPRALRHRRVHRAVLHHPLLTLAVAVHGTGGGVLRGEHAGAGQQQGGGGSENRGTHSGFSWLS
jgi:hypothetical protein